MSGSRIPLIPMESGGRLLDNGGGVLSDLGVLLRSASAENGDALMGADGVEEGALMDRSMLLRSAGDGPVSLDSDLERFNTLSLVTVATGALALVWVIQGGADTGIDLLMAGPLSLGGGW